jgi:uncharacterized protein
MSAAALVALLLTGCTASAEPVVTPTPTVAAPVDTSTLRGLAAAEAVTPALRVIEPAESLAAEQASLVEYDSGGLTISGVLRIPPGDGPFPAVVVVHGAVDPERYQPGGDLVSEQRALVEAGYVVLATDLRGYAESDPVPGDEGWETSSGFGWLGSLDWGMGWDVVSALRILRGGAVPEVDTERIGLVGHSLGGLLSLGAAVVAPEATDVVVSLSAPSSQVWDAVETMLPPDSPEYAQIVEQHGTPQDDPQYWADISPRTFIDGETPPLLLIHGGGDDTTSPQWSLDTADAWNAAGSRAEVFIIDGADHALAPDRAQATAYVLGALDLVLNP